MIKMKDLVYKRRMSKSTDNKASVITIPRAIAQAWEQYNTVELVFDGNCLVIKPINESYQQHRGDGSHEQ